MTSRAGGTAGLQSSAREMLLMPGANRSAARAEPRTPHQQDVCGFVQYEGQRSNSNQLNLKSDGVDSCDWEFQGGKSGFSGMA